MGCSGSNDKQQGGQSSRQTDEPYQIQRDAQGNAKVADAKAVFVMGGPGTGKSMVCEMIANQHEGIEMISPEELIKVELKDAWYLGKEISSSKMVALLVDAVFESKAKICLIDGFPRCKQNWADWNRQVNKSITVVMQIMFLAPRKLMRKNSSVKIREDMKESSQNLDRVELIKQSNLSNKLRQEYFDTHQSDLDAVLKKYGNLKKIPSNKKDDINNKVMELLTPFLN